MAWLMFFRIFGAGQGDRRGAKTEIRIRRAPGVFQHGLIPEGIGDLQTAGEMINLFPLLRQWSLHAFILKALKPLNIAIHVVCYHYWCCLSRHALIFLVVLHHLCLHFSGPSGRGGGARFDQRRLPSSPQQRAASLLHGD